MTCVSKFQSIRLERIDLGSIPLNDIIIDRPSSCIPKSALNSAIIFIEHLHGNISIQILANRHNGKLRAFKVAWDLVLQFSILSLLTVLI